MNFFRQLINTTPKLFTQKKNGRNRAAVQGLKSLGFPMPEIRLALVRLNNLDVPSLADGVSAATLYNTLKGIRSNAAAQEKLAAAFGIRREELFPANKDPD